MLFNVSLYKSSSWKSTYNKAFGLIQEHCILVYGKLAVNGGGYLLQKVSHLTYHSVKIDI